MTPKSGNILAVDSRHAQAIRLAYEAMIYAVTKALQKHEHVYFYNIYGKRLPSSIEICFIITEELSKNPEMGT